MEPDNFSENKPAALRCYDMPAAAGDPCSVGPMLAQSKALTIAQEVINTALAVQGIWQTPIANARLLRKLPFPNRSIPHRIKRRAKAKAKAELFIRVATSVLRAGFGIANLSRAIGTPAAMFTHKPSPVAHQ